MPNSATITTISASSSRQARKAKRRSRYTIRAMQGYGHRHRTADIIDQLGLRDPIELIGSFDRPNLVYRVLPRAGFKKQLLDVIARHRGEAGIVYCTSRREVDELAEWLSHEGTPALPYHAGLPDRARVENQDAFITERVQIVVATVAFGMGIDRSNVRFVVHAGAPRSLEHYQQEADARVATAWKRTARCSTPAPTSCAGRPCSSPAAS